MQLYRRVMEDWGLYTCDHIHSVPHSTSVEETSHHS